MNIKLVQCAILATLVVGGIQGSAKNQCTVLKDTEASLFDSSKQDVQNNNVPKNDSVGKGLVVYQPLVSQTQVQHSLKKACCEQNLYKMPQQLFVSKAALELLLQKEQEAKILELQQASQKNIQEINEQTEQLKMALQEFKLPQTQEQQQNTTINESGINSDSDDELPVAKPVTKLTAIPEEQNVFVNLHIGVSDKKETIEETPQIQKSIQEDINFVNEQIINEQKKLCEQLTKEIEFFQKKLKTANEENKDLGKQNENLSDEQLNKQYVSNAKEKEHKIANWETFCALMPLAAAFMFNQNTTKGFLSLLNFSSLSSKLCVMGIAATIKFGRPVYYKIAELF